MVYQQGTHISWQGLDIRISPINHLRDGRWKANIYILNCRGKKIVQQQVVSSVGENLPEFRERLPVFAQVLAQGQREVIISHLISEAPPHIPLETYVALQWPRIAVSARWARQEETYKNIWDRWLRPAFGALNLLGCDKILLEERMETLTHRKRRKTAQTADERMAWIILDGILRFAIQDGVLEMERSPVSAIARKCRKELSTIAARDLARQSLTMEEQRALVNICLQRRQDADEYTAMLIHYLHGVTVQELCGLSVGDWVRGLSISWLEITRMYRQLRDEEPIFTMLLDSQHAYRRVACTQITNELLRQQVKRLKQKGIHGADAPLFVDNKGARMTPYSYKMAVKGVLDEVIQCGATLHFSKRGTYLRGVERPTIFHGDMLRSTCEYNLRNLCNFPDSDVEAILGRYRLHTYAINYVDWTNSLVLSCQAEVINALWHSRMLNIGDVKRPVGQKGCLLVGHAEAGANMSLQSKFGCLGTIEEDKDER